MVGESQRDEAKAGAVAAVARCPVCGRRVPAADPGCPFHGPVPLPDDSENETSQVSFLKRAEFPGYRTVRVIGRGGFGTVFAAVPVAGGQTVAIKLSRSERLGAGRRLADESRALAAVGPPHVPAVYGLGALGDGSPYLIMEHINAPTLAERLAASSGPAPLSEVAAVAKAVLVALEAVHARGLVHADLKPENICIDGLTAATLIDFGLVEGAGFGRPPPVETTTEMGLTGTAEYMAPEQCDGGEIDARTDIYAMGVLLHELAAGRPPFWGPRAIVLRSHCELRPPRLGTLVAVSTRVEDLVLRCLAKEPKDRFASAAALRAAIDAAFPREDRLDTASVSTSPRSSVAPASSRQRFRVGLVSFDSEADVITIRRLILSSRGQLAHASRNRYVAVYEHDASGNPVRHASRAANELLKRGLCARALIDLAPVNVQLRPDGSRRFMSQLFGRADRFPAVTDPPGLFMTRAAEAMLPDMTGSPLPDERDWIHVGSAQPGATGAHPTPLIGRDDVLGDLLASAQRTAAHGVPSVVAVIAEPGHGKSRLAAELLDRLRAQAPRALVIELRAPEPAFDGADRTVRDLLHQILSLPAASPPDGGRTLLCERLGAARGAVMWPVVALSLGWLGPAAPELAARGAAPSALRSALTVAVGEALRRRAAHGPVFLVLDDAQFAADAVLAALEHATLADGEAPIWVCAFGRPGFEQGRPGWGERAGHRALHRLDPLDAPSAAALCRRLLLPVQDVPEPAVCHLVERAQAIPLLLVELIRGLKREGLVRRQPKGDSWYLATDELDRLPSASVLEWLAEDELNALAPSLRSHALLVALLGAEVTIPEIEGVLRRLEQDGNGAEFPLDARVGIQRLLSSGVLVHKPLGHVGFRSTLAREAVVRSLPEPLRRTIHLAALAHYDAEVPAIVEERRLVKVAFHAAEAGLVQLAETTYLELAERARARHAYVEAELLYSRVVERSTAPPLAVYRGRGLMRYRLGRYHDALGDLARAREMAILQGDPQAEMEILLDEATALDWMDEYKSSEARVERAQALSSTTAMTPALEARLLLGIGRSLHRFSREEEAVTLLERAAAAAENLGGDGYETLVIARMMLGFIYQGLGRLDEARGACDRAIRLCEEHGDAIHLVGAINNRALLRACLGDKSGMVADELRGLSIARALGQQVPELVGHYNLGEYLYLMDDLEAAAPHVERALVIERRRTGDDGRAAVTLLDARLRLYQGEQAAVRATIERIRARQEEARASGQSDRLMAPSEEVLWSMIELATREATGASEAEWDELASRSARWSVGQEHIEVLEMRAVTAARRGRHEEACRQFEKALAAAMRIPNVMGVRLRRGIDESRARWRQQAGSGSAAPPPMASDGAPGASDPDFDVEKNDRTTDPA